MICHEMNGGHQAGPMETDLGEALIIRQSEKLASRP